MSGARGAEQAATDRVVEALAIIRMAANVARGWKRRDEAAPA